MERRIAVGTTPTLEGYLRLRPAELLQAAVTSAEARVRSPGVPVGAFAACTLDTVAVVTTAAAMRGADTLAIAAATLVEGRRYLLTTAAGPLDVVSRSDGLVTAMRLASPLPLDVDAGAALTGHAILRALTTGETTLAGEAVVEWRATVDGQVLTWSELLRLVHRLPRATLTPTSLLRLRPQMRSLQLPDDLTYEDVIAGAWEARMLPLLANEGLFDEEVASDEALAPLHAFACVLHVVEDDPRFDRAFVEDLRTSFQALANRIMRGVAWDEQSPTTPAAAPRSKTKTEDHRRGIRVHR